MEKFCIVTMFLIISCLLWYGLYTLFGWAGIIIYFGLLVLFWNFIKDY